MSNKMDQSNCVKRFRQILNDVVNVLGTDRKTDGVGTYALLLELGFIELGMSR